MSLFSLYVTFPHIQLQRAVLSQECEVFGPGYKGGENRPQIRRRVNLERGVSGLHGCVSGSKVWEISFASPKGKACWVKATWKTMHQYLSSPPQPWRPRDAAPTSRSPPPGAEQQIYKRTTPRVAPRGSPPGRKAPLGSQALFKYCRISDTPELS